MDFARELIAAQSHRRMMDMGHLAKRQTAFVIERASNSPAASDRNGQASGPLIAEADHAQGNSL